MFALVYCEVSASGYACDNLVVNYFIVSEKVLFPGGFRCGDSDFWTVHESVIKKQTSKYSATSSGSGKFIKKTQTKKTKIYKNFTTTYSFVLSLLGFVIQFSFSFKYM